MKGKTQELSVEAKKKYINKNMLAALNVEDYDSVYNVYTYYKEVCKPSKLGKTTVERFNQLQDEVDELEAKMTMPNDEMKSELKSLTKTIDKKEKERHAYSYNLGRYRQAMQRLLNILNIKQGQDSNSREPIISNKDVVKQIYNIYKEIGEPELISEDLRDKVIYEREMENYLKQLKIYEEGMYYADLAIKTEARQKIARGSLAATF